MRQQQQHQLLPTSVSDDVAINATRTMGAEVSASTGVVLQPAHQSLMQSNDVYQIQEGGEEGGSKGEGVHKHQGQASQASQASLSQHHAIASSANLSPLPAFTPGASDSAHQHQHLTTQSIIPARMASDPGQHLVARAGPPNVAQIPQQPDDLTSLKHLSTSLASLGTLRTQSEHVPTTNHEHWQPKQVQSLLSHVQHSNPLDLLFEAALQHAPPTTLSSSQDASAGPRNSSTMSPPLDRSSWHMLSPHQPHSSSLSAQQRLQVNSPFAPTSSLGMSQMNPAPAQPSIGSFLAQARQVQVNRGEERRVWNELDDEAVHSQRQQEDTHGQDDTSPARPAGARANPYMIQPAPVTAAHAGRPYPTPVLGASPLRDVRTFLANSTHGLNTISAAAVYGLSPVQAGSTTMSIDNSQASGLTREVDVEAAATMAALASRVAGSFRQIRPSPPSLNMQNVVEQHQDQAAYSSMGPPSLIPSTQSGSAYHADSPQSDAYSNESYPNIEPIRPNSYAYVNHIQESIQVVKSDHNFSHDAPGLQAVARPLTTQPPPLQPKPVTQFPQIQPQVPTPSTSVTSLGVSSSDLMGLEDGGGGASTPAAASSAAASAPPKRKKRMRPESERPRPFLCEHLGCNATFIRRAHLVSHGVVHQTEKPFACSVCTAAFARRHDLLRHRRSLKHE